MNVRDETGFTLPELLLAITMFVIILLATLSIFDRATNLSSANARQNDSVEESRVAIDQVMRQLRNLASPTTPQSTIDTASKYDLIFQTDDPNKTWVRYCLDDTGGGSKPQGVLYYGFSAASSLTASQKGPCPGSGWGNNLKVVAQDVTNELGGLDRAVFSFICTPGSPAGCPANSADNSKIVVTGVRLFIDTTPNAVPAEKQVTSAVYLRNQNQSPAASFTSTNQTGTPRTVIFNGSASSDPEGRTLHYYWCDGSVTVCSTASSNFMGTGVTLTYTFADTSQHQISLTVVDPGGLTATIQQPVTPSNR